ncbi:MAG: PAS domain S-box protein, partial [Halobacteriales archaeon]
GSELAAGMPVNSSMQFPVGDRAVLLVGSPSANAFEPGDVDLARVLATTVAAAMERVDRERELETAKRRFDAVFHNPITFMGVLEPDGTVVEINETALEFVDRSLEDVVGEPFPETPWWSHSESLQEDLRSWIGEAAAGEPVRFEADHYAPDGGRVTIDGILHPIRDEGGEVVSVLAAGRDVSERKERERDLRRVKERFRRVFERSNDAIMIVDMEEEAFVEVNPAACEMLEYSREELLALHPEEIHPDDMDRVREEFLSRVYETGSGWTDDLSCVTKHGEEVPTEISGSTLRVDPDRDRPAKMVAILRDVSDRVAYERRLERQKRELQRQNERLERFASVVAHDLRNPLSLAEGYLKVVRETGDREALDDIADAHERMRTVIEDVLTVARDGQGVEEVTPVSFPPLLEAVWETVETPEATLVTEDPPAAVAADEDRLRQVLGNLFRNAVEHAGDDVTVTVGGLPDGFYVADDGPGIDEADRERVFEYGYSTADDGTGYGLAIVKELVEAHGWSVTATASDGGGARFEIAGIDVDGDSRLPKTSTG